MMLNNNLKLNIFNYSNNARLYRILQLNYFDKMDKYQLLKHRFCKMTPHTISKMSPRSYKILYKNISKIILWDIDVYFGYKFIYGCQSIYRSIIPCCIRAENNTKQVKYILNFLKKKIKIDSYRMMLSECFNDLIFNGNLKINSAMKVFLKEILDNKLIIYHHTYDILKINYLHFIPADLQSFKFLYKYLFKNGYLINYFFENNYLPTEQDRFYSYANNFKKTYIKTIVKHELKNSHHDDPYISYLMNVYTRI